MPIDPRQLGPSELCRLLNSTPLGEVLNERQLHRHRTRAGIRIAEGSKIDLYRYVGWLSWNYHDVRRKQRERNASGLTGYEAQKENARLRNARLSASGRDIGELPSVVNPERKAKAAESFQFFCEAYFPNTFHLAWSADHLKVITKIELAVREGGLFALAMPRGSASPLGEHRSMSDVSHVHGLHALVRHCTDLEGRYPGKPALPAGF